MILTMQMLQDLHACDEQVSIFRKVFPAGRATLTVRNWAKARKAGLEVGWLVRLLSGERRDAYYANMSRAGSKRDRAEGAARKEQLRAADEAWLRFRDSLNWGYAQQMFDDYLRITARVHDKAYRRAGAQYRTDRDDKLYLLLHEQFDRKS